MKRFDQMLSLVLALLLVAGNAQAVECADNVLNTGTVTVCRVDVVHAQLQLFWRDDTGQPYRRFAALRDALAKQGKTLEFSMNGGMYRPDYSPVGLFVADGCELNPLNRHTGPGNFSQQPNGVFLVDGHGLICSRPTNMPRKSHTRCWRRSRGLCWSTTEN